MSIHEASLELAARQHGIVLVAQLTEAGASHEVVRHLVGSGQWIRVTPMILRRAGTPRTRAQELVEAVLDAGRAAALSHLPAAAWWKLNVKPGGLDVMRQRGTTTVAARLTRIHEPRFFPDHHRTVFEGVPITIPCRLPFDIAATAPAMAERVLDRAWARHLVGYRSTQQMLSELAERGRPGITLMRELLAVRGPDYRPNDSNLEDRFQQLAREAGIHGLVRQCELFGEEWLGRVDFLWVERKLVIEVQSALYHDALVDRRSDERRRAAMVDADYRVETFCDTEIWFDPPGTVARLRRLRAESNRSGTGSRGQDPEIRCQNSGF